MKVPWRSIIKINIYVFIGAIIIKNFAHTIVFAEQFNPITQTDLFVASRWQVVLIALLTLGILFALLLEGSKPIVDEA